VTSIEVFFGVIIFIFTVVGVIRGFLKELGVTLAMMFLLFFLSRFEAPIFRGLDKAMAVGARIIGKADHAVFQAWLLIFVVTAAAFLSYHGETLAYSGTAPRGGQGVILGAMIGMFNGYLIAGSVWYYMDRFDYPIKLFGFTKEGLSKLALDLIPLLPGNFLGREVLFGQSLLLFFTALLFLARVIR